MRVLFQVSSGVQTGRKLWLKPGQTLIVGRDETADFACADDGTMSPRHFALEIKADGCELRDLGSTSGTTVNGQPRALSELSNGDGILAGNTSFTIKIEGAAPVPTNGPAGPNVDIPLEVVKEQLVTFFRGLPDPLFAILDAARHPMVLPLLIQSAHEYQSLYEGPKGEALAAAAPYLVKLPPDSSLLEMLVDQGWGDSWGVYLTSNTPFKEVRKHFRRFLMVKTEEDKEVYFRFYDPRVLRVFLPTCLPDEANQFFGSVGTFFVEDDSPGNMLQFSARHQGAKEIVNFVPGPVMVSE